ncbi:beta-lactamase-like protein [Amylocarpus encephaloides]|uniref:Cleavage and polyadenylation specificity factor subunit 2 n=1 Tax=Amylocarpus encephaloides TaxID=45428 RepID=A0A9P7YK33_9HELO|nr:beta-lactamase-like protein [Amylocarpus encephaloides]
MFTFCSLLGAQSQSSASQSLLELDGGVKILIDVGWDETFDVGKLKELEKAVSTLSVILLTHATTAHLAAFAHCCKHFPLFKRIPIYATVPVIALGRTLIQDLYSSTPLASTIIPPESLTETSYSYSQSSSSEEEKRILLQPPTAEEIASYFDLVHALKYSQPHEPLPSPWSPPLNGLTVTAYNAGHTLGGTIWHIQHGLESIVYAVDWNQSRENVLAGAAWLGGAGGGGAEVIEQLRKPTALICSSRGGERVALSGGKRKRDELLLDMIKSCVSKGGVVLIPTDSSARVLELAYLLEHAWRKEMANDDSPLLSAKPYLASRNIQATMRYARSMFEWMDEGIVREFEVDAGLQKDNNETSDKLGTGAGPFDFKHLRLIERKGQIDHALKEVDNLGRSVGKVILASDTSMEWGFSKEILRKICDDRRNLVIFTERLGQPGVESNKFGMARTLWSWWEDRKHGVAAEPATSGDALEQVYGGGREVELRESSRVALEGGDLAVYQQWLATQRQLQTTQAGGATTLESSADMIDDASSDSSSDSEGSETEQQGKALNISATMGQASRKKIGLSDEDLGINILLRKRGVHDYDVRGKKGREKMFPLVFRRRRNDDFGELIRAEDFQMADQRDDIDERNMRPSKYDTKDTLGKKRKWDDGAATNGRMPLGDNKRQQMGNGPNPEQALGLDNNVELEPEVEEITGPSRVVTTIETLTVDLRLAFVDFGGVHDKRSLQMLIPLIQPRKLIFTCGYKNETLALAADCRRILAAKIGGDETAIDVYTPEIGVWVDASVDTNAWAVKLTDTLVKRLRWQNVKGLGIVTVTGRLEATSQPVPEADEEGAKKRQKVLKDSSKSPEPSSTDLVPVPPPAQIEVPSLDVLPTSMASATRSIAQPLHVGDLRLADLRKLMLASGHTAEFRGEGSLLIDGSVIVRKTGTGKIEIESSGVSAIPQREGTFWAVKSKIYEGLAVVGG